MINILKRKTQMASAALVTGIMLSPSLALASGNAVDLKSQTEQLGRQSEALPQLINGVFFIAGIGLVGLGLFGVKKHVDSGGQEKLPPALAKAGIGGALMALPVFAENAINTLIGTTSSNSLSVNSVSTDIF